MNRATTIALIAAGATAGEMRMPAAAQTGAPIRVVTIPNESAAEVFYAQDMGFFEKAGIAVDIQMMQNGVPAAVAGGATDLGYVTLDALSTAHRKGVPLVAVAAAAEYQFPVTSRIAGLIVSPNSPIHQAKDLNGKVIAQPSLQGISENSTRAWIDQNGGDSSTVKFIELAFAAMPAALDAGRVDAAHVAEPFMSVALKHGRLLADDYHAIGNHFIASAWTTTRQWATEHPDLVRRFAAVIRETAGWANQNLPKSGEILGKYTKIDPALIATMVRSRYAAELTPATMQPVIDLSAKYNNIGTFPAAELIFTPPR